jgi:hypothetical protein
MPFLLMEPALPKHAAANKANWLASATSLAKKLAKKPDDRDPSLFKDYRDLGNRIKKGNHGDHNTRCGDLLGTLRGWIAEVEERTLDSRFY